MATCQFFWDASCLPVSRHEEKDWACSGVSVVLISMLYAFSRGRKTSRSMSISHLYWLYNSLLKPQT